MGTVLASTILAEVDIVLLDTAKTRWPDPEKLIYLNAGQREIVFLKPDANVVNDVYKLVAGTKQSIPDGTDSFQNAASATLKEGFAFIKVLRNMGANGLTPGAIIQPCGADLLDAYAPGWHTETANLLVDNYIYDDTDPKRFYVTPPNINTGYVEVKYSALPDEVASTASAIELSDTYQNVLRDYILFRCYAKDAALSPHNAQRSIACWNMFVSTLGRMDLIKKEISPNTKQNNPSTEARP